MEDGIMQNSIGAATEVNTRKFRSPTRILVRSFRMSRDNWKEKYQELQKKLKRLQVQAYDACKSRDSWRERAKNAEGEVAKLLSEQTCSVSPESDVSKKK